MPEVKLKNRECKRDLGLFISFYKHILSYMANTDQHSEVPEMLLGHSLQMSVKDAEYPLLPLATVGMELIIA